MLHTYKHFYDIIHEHYTHKLNIEDIHNTYFSSFLLALLLFTLTHNIEFVVLAKANKK